MLDMDDYVKNVEDSEAAADSYDTYIGAELNFQDADRNAVYGCVKKQVWNDDGQAVGAVNQNPLINSIKYEVEYLDGYIEILIPTKLLKICYQILTPKAINSS